MNDLHGDGDDEMGVVEVFTVEFVDGDVRISGIYIDR